MKPIIGHYYETRDGRTAKILSRENAVLFIGEHDSGVHPNLKLKFKLDWNGLCPDRPQLDLIRKIDHCAFCDTIEICKHRSLGDIVPSP